MTERSFLRRLGFTIRFEVSDLIERRLPWVGLVAVVGAALLQGWIAGRSDEPPTGFALLADILGTGLPLAALIGLLVASMGVNDAVSTGALRALLLRPVGRIEVGLAKIAAASGFALVLAGAVIAVAAAWVATHGGFSAIYLEIPGFEATAKFDMATMRGYAVTLVVCTLPALLCAPVAGFLISASVDSTGASVTVAVLAALAMQAAAAADEALAVWVPSHYLTLPTTRLGELAGAVETHVPWIEGLTPVSPVIVIPMLFVVILGAAGVTIFCRRDYRCRCARPW